MNLWEEDVSIKVYNESCSFATSKLDNFSFSFPYNCVTKCSPETRKNVQNNLTPL